MTPSSPHNETVAEAVEALSDVITHRRAWQDAIVLARGKASEGSEQPDADRSYWNHELKAFNRTFAGLSTLVAALAWFAECDNLILAASSTEEAWEVRRASGVLRGAGPTPVEAIFAAYFAKADA